MIRIKPDGTYTVLADRYQGKRFNSPNDVVIGPDGAIYFTDPTSDLPKDQKQELDFKGVFRLDAQGQVTLLTKELTEPNGLAFSPDGKTVVCGRQHAKKYSGLRFPSRTEHFAMAAFLAKSRAAREKAFRTG